MPTRSTRSTAHAPTQSAPGLWKALQAISRLAHAGCKAGDLDVTAFNGRLFSPRHSPLVEQRHVPDAVMRDVLLALATEVTTAGPAPHFVSRPRRRAAGLGLRARARARAGERRQRAIVLTRTSTRRKTTGSFYTPQALTEFLVQTNAGAARRGPNRRRDPRSCASSIRRWAAARFSSRRACFLRTAASRR